MLKAHIVKRINEKMFEGLYSYEDMKYELDDAIILINNTMHSKFPFMSEFFEATPEGNYDFFPEEYIRSVVIEYVVSALYRREGEFSNEFNTAVGAYNRGLEVMFRDHYHRVPEEYLDQEVGVIAMNPFEVENDGS